jgi:hypothetical protein
MTTRNALLCLAGLLVTSVLGCNEIVGIHRATEGDGISCSPELEVSTDRAVGCLFRIACDPFLPPFSMSQCVGMAWQDSAPSETCSYAATSCADVDACIGRRYEPAATCTDTSGWTCDESGERAINCTPAGGYSIDCELFGGSCLPHSSTVEQTAFACQTVDAPTCPEGAEEGAYYCEGTQRFTCIDGEPRGVDCAAISSDCIEFGPGEAYCSDRTESCSDLGLVTCEGDVIEACDVNGYRVQFDCSTGGLGCGEDSVTDDIACLADGCETTTGCEESCLDDGKTLHFCAGGVPFVMDCTEYGYDGCLEDELGDGVPLAYCARGTGSDPHP